MQQTRQSTSEEEKKFFIEGLAVLGNSAVYRLPAEIKALSRRKIVAQHGGDYSSDEDNLKENAHQPRPKQKAAARWKNVLRSGSGAARSCQEAIIQARIANLRFI